MEELVPVHQIRRLAEFKDDALVKKMFAYIVCETMGGLKIGEIPTKAHKVEIARECLRRGWDKKRITNALKISRTTLYRITHETN